jgi:hypothetical protein
MKNYVRVWCRHLLIAVIYIGLICFVAFCVIKPRISHTQVQRFSNIHFRATRDLSINHHLRPRDIERPVDLAGSLYWYLPRNDQLEGMYMKKKVMRGDPVRVSDVQAWPNLVTQKCCVAIPFSLQDQPLLQELLNAESQVIICPPAGECVASARVQAVICGKQESPCYVVIEVSRNDESKVREAVAKGKLQIIPTTLQETKGDAPWDNRPGDKLER